MQLCSNGTDAFGQSRFDVHVHVFQLNRNGNFLLVIAASIWQRPFSVWLSSSRVRIPALSSALACAIEPRISNRYSRQSNETDSEKRCKAGAVSCRNRPFHIAEGICRRGD